MAVKDLAEYIETVDKTVESWKMDRTTMNPWFRGQSRTAWGLEPKIYRKNKTKGASERELIRDFRLYSHPYVSERPADDFEWLFLMQHYGMPTRLLDWTESSLIALFFACGDLDETADAAVWVLQPWSLNIAVLNVHSVPTYKAQSLQEYLLPATDEIDRRIKASYPAALRPLRNSKRIIAQKGTFTIHGNEKTPIDALNSDPIFCKQTNKKLLLFKIEIAGTSKRAIYKELYFSGVNTSIVFPELEGLAAELAYRYSPDF